MGGNQQAGHDDPRTRRALDGVLDHMAQGVAFARLDGDRLWLDDVNPAFARQSGYAVDELRDTPFERLVGPATDRATLTRLVERALSTRCPIGARLQLHGKDGVAFPVELGLVPLEAARLLVLLREGAAPLGDELASASALAAGLSHEIMSPLATALTHIELMEEALPRLLGQVERAAPELVGEIVRLDEHAVAARRAVEQVGQAVRSLQVLAARHEAPGHELQLAEVVDAAIRQARPHLGGRAQLVRSYQAVPAVRGDSERVQQIFVQLLLHLARALPEGRADQRQVRVSLNADATGGTVATITCIAPEIPPAHLTEGLGRRISEALVTAHRGHLVVQLEARGARFEIHLPGVAAAPRRGRVLIVDDDVHLVASLCQALGEEHEVEGAPSGRAALERLRLTASWDLILCDVQMDGLSGIDVVAALERESPALADRVVFMTGGVSDGGARDYLARSARECLGKPFELDTLRALVRRKLRAA